MRAPSWKRFFLSVLILLFSSCFGGVDKRGSVTGYRPGVVSTEGGLFRIGHLPAAWKRKSFNYRALLFIHSGLKSSITVDSFCKGSFDDAPLNTLSQQLFYNLSGLKQHSQTKLRLDDREALRTVVSGQVDGAPVTMDAVVLKMNECVFDFVYLADPADYPSGLADFEGLYQGFRYVKGPRID